MTEVSVRYYPEADTAYISFVSVETTAERQLVAVADDRSGTPDDFPPEVVLDFDRDGRLIGLELLSADRQLTPDLRAAAVVITE